MVLINLNFNNFSEANTLKSIFNGLGNEFEYTEKGIFRRKKPPQCPECGNSMNHNGFNSGGAERAEREVPMPSGWG